MSVPLHDLITSLRTHLQIPSHWQLTFQHMNLRGVEVGVGCKGCLSFAGLKCYLSVVLICISSCSYWPFVYFFGDMSIQAFCPFLSSIACLMLLRCKIFVFMFWVLIPYQVYDLQTFSSIFWLNIDEVKLIFFFLPMLLVS